LQERGAWVIGRNIESELLAFLDAEPIMAYDKGIAGQSQKDSLLLQDDACVQFASRPHVTRSGDRHADQHVE